MKMFNNPFGHNPLARLLSMPIPSAADLRPIAPAWQPGVRRTILNKKLAGAYSGAQIREFNSRNGVGNPRHRRPVK